MKVWLTPSSIQKTPLPRLLTSPRTKSRDLRRPQGTAGNSLAGERELKKPAAAIGPIKNETEQLLAPTCIKGENMPGTPEPGCSSHGKDDSLPSPSPISTPGSVAHHLERPARYGNDFPTLAEASRQPKKAKSRASNQQVPELMPPVLSTIHQDPGSGRMPLSGVQAARLAAINDHRLQSSQPADDHNNNQGPVLYLTHRGGRHIPWYHNPCAT